MLFAAFAGVVLGSGHKGKLTAFEEVDHTEARVVCLHHALRTDIGGQSMAR